ncbi:MAG: hypothetical protein V3S24_00425, partial [Candidatus Tectomicrobia bacterium]
SRSYHLPGAERVPVVPPMPRFQTGGMLGSEVFVNVIITRCMGEETDIQLVLYEEDGVAAHEISF